MFNNLEAGDPVREVKYRETLASSSYNPERKVKNNKNSSLRGNKNRNISK